MEEDPRKEGIKITHFVGMRLEDEIKLHNQVQQIVKEAEKSIKKYFDYLDSIKYNKKLREHILKTYKQQIIG